MNLLTVLLILIVVPVVVATLICLPGFMLARHYDDMERKYGRGWWYK